MKSSGRTFNFEENRILVWFSCGSTSAVAAHMMRDYPNAEFIYCDTGSEHPSNKKFMEDVSNWIDREIKVLKSDQFDNVDEVINYHRYLVGVAGAKCTLELKKSLRQGYEDFDDIHVFGYDFEEIKRAERFIKEHFELKLYFPLIERKITKAMSLQILREAGIDLPFMYQPQKSGSPYDHNNCIGCVKGGMGYWSKIFIDFPEVYQTRMRQELEIGAAINHKKLKYDKMMSFLKENHEANHPIWRWYRRSLGMIWDKKFKNKLIRTPVYLDVMEIKPELFRKEGKMSCDMFCTIEAKEYLKEDER